MESASQAPVTFSDIMCQMHDMLSPAVPGQYTLRDLRKARALAGTLFNILFNLGKFVAYETRDPFMQRQEKADDPDASDWDRCGLAKHACTACMFLALELQLACVTLPWRSQICVSVISAQ